MSRRRGRIYLGPVNAGALRVNGTTKETYVDQQTQDNLCSSMEQLEADARQIDQCRWVVYSRTTRSAQPVIGGWVNTDPDTQRRRSFDQGTKRFWSVV